ncbi:zinc finger protein 40 isoform X2 [Rhinoraja longicauda]
MRLNMPRRKQVNPKPLRELQELRRKGKPNAAKGVKRKKVVAENVTKKIPKSLVKTLLKLSNDGQSAEAVFSVDGVPAAASPLKKEPLLDQNGGLERGEGEVGQEYSEGLSFAGEATVARAGKPLQRKISAPQHSVESCNKSPSWSAHQLDTDATLKLLVAEKPPPRSSEHQIQRLSLLRQHWIIKAEGKGCTTNGSSPYASSAFDVLLKAMEPELKTLSKMKFPAADPGPRKPDVGAAAQGVSGGLSTVAAQGPCQPSACESEYAAGPQYYPNATQIVAKSGNRQQAPGQPPSHLHYQHVLHAKQEHALSQRFNGSPTHQQNQGKHHFQPTYNLTMTSLGQSQPTHFDVPYRLHQSQLLVNSNQPMAANPPNGDQMGSSYKQLQLTSVLNSGVEQASNSPLKDQRPKKQGKYICEYCNRACAKPSVLQKHIRSHTGERPYPCVTCGFSFKTKSNLYKHKKSHAHAIKLGLVLRSGGSSTSASQDSDRGVSVQSDVEESCESEADSACEERYSDQKHFEQEAAREAGDACCTGAAAVFPGSLSSPSGKPGNKAGGYESVAPHKGAESKVAAALPKVVVYPVNVSPARADSPAGTAPEPANPQRHVNPQAPATEPASAWASWTKQDPGGNGERQVEMSPPEEDKAQPVTPHAQLQRQQATEQGKHHLSPRSLGSTDSGYFSRSESADQQMSPLSPFVKSLPTDVDPTKGTFPSMPHGCQIMATVLQMNSISVEKLSKSTAPARAQMATKMLEERISKLISDNEAVVDDKQLDSVKPRRTSLSRRGSIDSPKPYTFKDSFQFDLRPLHSGRRTSSSSDIPKSPFTPTDKSKQVFLLSVPPPFPSLDCLPITRSNSMPATPANSAVPASVTPAAHPLRGSQSFDDKIGVPFSDDVFVPGPQGSAHLAHARTLVRQTAVEDPSTGEAQGFASTRSMDEGLRRSAVAAGLVMPRSKSFEHGRRPQERGRKPQGRGSMYECETCRNRYRKLENFENHKKFYCSELHGPKAKPTAMKDSEQEAISRSMSPQLLHLRVMGAAGVLQQPLKMRKRKKIKSIGDDDEPSPSVGTVNKEPPSARLSAAPLDASHRHNVTGGGSPPTSVGAKFPPGEHLQAGEQDHSREEPVSFSNETQSKPLPSPSQEREPSRTSSGVSVIQHTNSLSRPSSFEHLESVDKGSPVPVQEKEGHRETMQLSPFAGEKEDACGLPASQQQQQQPNPGVSRAAACEPSRPSPAECASLPPPQRLVRQRNIQVPEILVTEEPDQEQEAQGSEQAETFHWPQRSETLSNLPTEKLPPKKKRIRLAEMEHSSGESSFDSTLSRSFSQESNLSCSSLSASLDREDLPRTESPSKLEALSKLPELALVSRSNTLGIPNAHHREMRRAASEQNNSVPSSAQVTTGIRSKSFDCGIISTTISPSPEVSMEIISTVASEILASGSVSLIERRRGSLLRQMSLSIGPDIPQPQVLPSSLFPQNLTLQVATLPQLKRSLSNRLSPLSFLTSQHQLSYVTQVQHVVHPEPQSSIQEISANNQIQVKQPLVQTSSLAQRPEACSVAQGSLKVMPAKITADPQKLCSIISLPPGNERNIYAPKYQLQIVQNQCCQSCVLPHVSSQLPVVPLSIPVALGSSAVTRNMTTKSLEIISNLYLVPPVQHVHPGQVANQLLPGASLIRPVGIQCTKPTCSTAIRSTLPQILVTQDQTNLVICKFDDPIHSSAPEDYLEAQKNKIKMSAIGDNCHSLVESRTALVASGSKMPSDCLLAQEPTGTSKRMLSPANSLDIAMEKHQKRVKDENGQVTQVPLQSTNSVEINKLKKPMLVRQHCTTDQPESSLPAEEEAPLRNNSQILELNSSPTKPPRELPVLSKEALESEGSTSSSGTVIHKSPRIAFSSSPQANAILSKSATNTQGETSASSNDQVQLVHHRAQIKMRSSFPVTSTRDVQCATLSTLKTSTNFSWCYLKKCKPLHTQQVDRKLSAYSTWHISPNNPNPLGLPTKVILGLLNSKQKVKKMMYTQARNTVLHSGILVSSSKWKADKSKALANRTPAISEHNSTDRYDSPGGDSDKDHGAIEPRRIKIFDGGFKSNEEYVYVRGRGRGKYICEECGIRCKKPSMLRKHIRTHTDLRPYHCNYCNFSFKTKGNLTKHMKSKAHSKKCMEIGVSAGPFDDQDTDESGDKPRGGNECTYSDAEDSDGQDEEDYEIDDDDEDSQGEVGLSATPSVAASPQHSAQCSDQLGTLNAASASLMADDMRTTGDCLRQAHHLDGLPGAWLGATARDPDAAGSKPSPVHWYAADEEAIVFPSAGGTLPYAGPRCTADSRQLHGILGRITADDSQIPPSISLPPQMVVERQSTWRSPASSPGRLDGQQQRQQRQALGEGRPGHLFSHLPLHSQQQAKTPYSMVPVGGIQLVQAGLAAYSTFVPIHAGPLQLSIPAVSILHQTSRCQDSAYATGHTAPTSATDTETSLPSMLFGQVNSTNKHGADTSDFQAANPSGAETLQPLGLVSLSTGSQVGFPSSLSFKTVDLQVLTTSPRAQCTPGPQTHAPGMQILNIALPALVPPLDAGQTSITKHCAPTDFTNSSRQAAPVEVSAPHPGRTQLSQVSHQTRACSPKTDSPSRIQGQPSNARATQQLKANRNKPTAAASLNSDSGHSPRSSEQAASSPVHWAASPERPRGKPVGSARGAVMYSDVSSDDEDRLVIAT